MLRRNRVFDCFLSKKVRVLAGFHCFLPPLFRRNFRVVFREARTEHEIEPNKDLSQPRMYRHTWMPPGPGSVGIKGEQISGSYITPIY